MLSIQLEKGDMQFIDNLAILHAREAFVVSDETDKKRSTVKMWLAYDDLA